MRELMRKRGDAELDPSSCNRGRAMGRVLLTVMILLLLFNIGANSENLPVLVVTHLRLEYLTNPLGIDAARPRLSWTLASANDSLRDQRQTAYQIVVASSP